jgi:TPR repeat protein
MTPRRGWLRVAATLIAILGAAPAPHAADFKSGVDAFDAGDVESAWLQFWMLAQDGDAAAQYNLAQFYRQGIGVEVDLREARRWYERAANQGHGFAQYALGLMYETGDGDRCARPPSPPHRLAALGGGAPVRRVGTFVSR